MFYHVVIEVIPDDCMLHRVKDYIFENQEDAFQYYNECLDDLEKFRDDFAELFGFPKNYLVDPDDFNEETNEDNDEENEDDEPYATLYVSETVSMVLCPFDINDYINNGSLIGYSYSNWFNDYDEMSFDNHCMTFIDFLDNNNAKIIHSGDFGYFLSNQ